MNNYFINDFFADSTLMYSYLDELHLYTGTERSGQKFFNRTKGKENKPESTKFGWTWRKRLTDTTERTWDPEVGLYRTKIMDDHPYLLDIFKEYSNNHFPHFKWTQVQINRMPNGSSIRQHLDKKNVGESVLVAFGDYKGGRTFIKNDKDNNFIVTDCREEIAIFNGAERPHGVSSITSGKRYSLVFYKDNLKAMKKY